MLPFVVTAVEAVFWGASLIGAADQPDVNGYPYTWAALLAPLLLLRRPFPDRRQVGASVAATAVAAWSASRLAESGWPLADLAGLAVAAAAEELVWRGAILATAVAVIARLRPDRSPVPAAVAATSVLFLALPWHVDAITVAWRLHPVSGLAAGVSLAGVAGLFALVALRPAGLAVAAALHVAWNLTTAAGQEGADHGLRLPLTVVLVAAAAVAARRPATQTAR